MEFRVRPSLAGENVVRRESVVGARDMIVKEYCMVNCHGPQLRVGHFGPVDSSMDEQSSSNGHDVLYSFLRNAIVVVSPSTSKLARLFEFSKVVRILKAGE